MKRKPLLRLVPVLLLVLLSCCRQEKKEEKSSAVLQPAPTAETEVDKWSNQISSNPKNAEAYFQRARLYEGMQKFKEASSDISKAISLDSARSDYYLIQADIQFANLQIPQASASFYKSIDLDPKNMEAWLKLAELNLYIKQYEESIRCANEALRIDKHRAKAYFIKGFVFKESGDTARAISSFETCVEQEAGNYDAYMQLGILNGARKNKIAVQYYTDALKLNPKSIEALYDRGLFYQETKEYNKAMEDYTAILQIDPKYKDAHYNLGYIHLVYLKVYDQAIKHFTDAINADPYFVQAYYNRGLCFENLGDIAAAAADYKKALGIFPTYDLAKKGLKRLAK